MSVYYRIVIRKLYILVDSAFFVSLLEVLHSLELFFECCLIIVLASVTLTLLVVRKTYVSLCSLVFWANERPSGGRNFRKLSMT